VHLLPYGSQRLMEIAIALATRPRVLLLDEPAAGVPAARSQAVFERIETLPRDLTILFVEHDMNIVFRFAQRITVLVGGRVLTEGAPAEISANAQVRAVYLGRGRHAAA
jgi:branched-chain amino acid transport system ATP-binding protein